MSLVSIEGKYEILGKLREGGMGAVYKVRHRLLDEIRVVKVIRPQLVATPELSDRFLREARLAIQLRHPNIAQLHDFSVDPDGSAFIVLEFIDGATLDDLLKATGPPPLGLGLDIAQQSLRALGYLHRKGFVHRDIAPDNLMLTRDVDGRPLVKLIDLGIAKVLVGGGGLTVAGMFLGKPRYASPEQFGSEGEAGMDARSDLYSLGVVLYELLTGTHPIPGRDPSSFMAGHMLRPPVDFSVSDPEGRLPADLREILTRVLAKKPEERFATAEEMAQAVAAVQARFPATVVDLERVLLRASRVSSVENAGPPGSTQDQFDRRFAKEATPAAAAVNLDATQILRPSVPLVPEPAAPVAPVVSPVPPVRPREVDLEETGFLRQAAPAEKSLTPVPSPIALPPPGRGAPPPVTAVDRTSSQERRRVVPWRMVVAGFLVVVVVAGLVGWFLFSGKAVPSRSEPVDSPAPVVSESPAAPVIQETPEPAAASSTASVELPAAETPPVVPVVVESPAPDPEPTPTPVAPVPVRPSAPKPRATPAPVAVAPERTPVPRAPVKERKTVAVPVDSGERKGRRDAEAAEDEVEVEDARVVSSPAAVYPEGARTSGAYAMISVSVLVDEKGKVVDAKVKGAFVDGGAGADFRKAALEAARQARFDPATRNGVPVKMWGELTYEFGTKKP